MPAKHAQVYVTHTHTNKRTNKHTIFTHLTILEELVEQLLALLESLNLLLLGLGALLLELGTVVLLPFTARNAFTSATHDMGMGSAMGAKRKEYLLCQFETRLLYMFHTQSSHGFFFTL